VALILFAVLPLVIALFVMIFRMNHAEHYAPPAYYRQKTGGAPIAFGIDSLGPRARKHLQRGSAEED